MPNEIPIAQRLSIRDAGLNEYWLQDQIYENPGALGLGELEGVSKEKQQSSGGRLDMLLKDPGDDTMYEVEVMLGETDESHIIRTIEYWDNEKRRWPQREHFAVLVAEHIDRRFFKVIHLLSYSIPIIAIQALLLESEGKRLLFFSKILDTFEEADDGVASDGGTYTRDYWATKAQWTLDTADCLLEITQGTFKNATLNYVKNYMATKVSGSNYIWLRKRSGNKSLLGFRMAESLQDQAAALLDEKNISYVRKARKFFITVDKQMIENNQAVFCSIAELVKETWETAD